MHNINLKKVNLNDLEALQKIGKQTFLETFAAHNSAKNMETYLSNSFDTQKLHLEITNEYSQFFIAMQNQEVLGYLKVNFAEAQTEINDTNALEIERIYVLEAFHGKKVGQVLFDKALEIALAAKVDYLWLGVWEKNEKALHFYKKNGFVVFDKHLFKLGNDVQTDYLMKLNLKK